jgi:8-oxo-dGTP pyrophosphatase MutT (NUDIX family)
MNFNSFTESDFKGKISSSNFSPIYDPFPKNTFDSPPKEASVLIPLIFENDIWKILFIKRAIIEGDHHSAQVSLPGGGKESSDKNNIETAARETEEEIGISRQNMHILGQLKPYRTISNFHVTPVVATIPWPNQLTLSSDEVDKVFSIPLNWLSSKSNYTTDVRKISEDYSMPVIYFNNFRNETLWGATAKFILDFLTILKSTS